MPYVDLNTIHVPTTGAVAPAAWGTQVRLNQEFLIDPPACTVFHSTTTSATAAALTVLAADSELFDNDAMHSTITNNSRITIQTPGRYNFFTCVEFPARASPNGHRFVEFLVNATDRIFVEQVPGEGTGYTVQVILSGSRALQLVAGDFVEVRARHSDSGGAMGITLNEFSAVFLTR